MPLMAEDILVFMARPQSMAAAAYYPSTRQHSSDGLAHSEKRARRRSVKPHEKVNNDNNIFFFATGAIT